MTNPKNRLREMLAGYVDDELSPHEKSEFEAALAESKELRDELAEFKSLSEVTCSVQYADLPPEVWENYWQSLYRKTERGFGWILMSLSAILLASFGLYEAFKELYLDPTAPLWVKLGLTGVTSGAVILLVSYGRERIFAYNRDRYRKVDR